jgi:hypothetical protein
MNPTSKSPLPAVLDPVVAAVLEQLKEKVEAKDRIIAEKDQALSAAEAIIQQLKEARGALRPAQREAIGPAVSAARFGTWCIER